MLNLDTVKTSTEFDMFSRIHKLDVNFNVSSILFSKYKRLFADLIYDDDEELDSGITEDDGDNECAEIPLLLHNDDDQSERCTDLHHKSKRFRSNSFRHLLRSSSHSSTNNNKSKSGPNESNVITCRDLFKFGWLFFIFIRGKLYILRDHC